MAIIDQIDKSKLPQHVAIIMDGNGRWATAQGKSRSEGHWEGVTSVRKVVEAATAVGLQFLTVYTFSMENWHRPDEEVQALMELLVASVERETPDLMRNNVRLLAIGDLRRLQSTVRQPLLNAIQQTANNTGTTLVLALSYSARWEIVNATKHIAQDVARGNISIDEVNEQLFESYLTTQRIPEPDLLIRTGGEKRISNFLLWQLAYTELYFTDTFWPDFREEQLYHAIIHFQQRNRRFGKITTQLN